MSLLAVATLVLAAAATVILVAYLVRRPKLSGAAKVWLFLGVGVLPIAATFSGNVAGFEVTTTREFCSSCHTMQRFAVDAANLESTSLASLHSRSVMNGGHSCYHCHRDYAMFGTVTTKVAGLKHVWAYYTGRADEVPKLYQPFTNQACTQCHSTTLPGWKDEPEHSAIEAEIKSGEATCVAKGCHGPAHPEKEP